VIGTMILANRYRGETKTIRLNIWGFFSSIGNFCKSLLIRK
jgi:hypothetical protein